MNLKRLFNWPYLRQNLKKSKGLLAIILGIIPILNLLIFIAINVLSNSEASTLSRISTVAILGLYTIPILLSMALFGFVFKRKSVDFMMSMPLERKTIFVTNTIGGIGLMIAMLLLNILLMGLVSLWVPAVPGAMLLDYLVIWTISYLFVFTLTNLAMTISGNRITQLIVTALFLFLIPFCYDTFIHNNESYQYLTSYVECTTESCKPETYLCATNDLLCQERKNNNQYAIDLRQENNNYTMPYQLIRSRLDWNDLILYNGGQLLKMTLISVFAFILGIYLFNRRKMEVCETSFENFHVHSIVKCLTMIPFILFVYDTLLDGDFIFVIIVLFIFLIYFFIYDLITRRSIIRWQHSLLYFSGVVIFTFALSLIPRPIFHSQEVILNQEEIAAIEIPEAQLSYEGDIIHYQGKFEEKESIGHLLKWMNTDLSQEAYGVMEIKIELMNGKKYNSSIVLGESQIKSFVEDMPSGFVYKNAYDELKENRIFAISYSNSDLYSPKQRKGLLDRLNKIMSEIDEQKIYPIDNNYNQIITVYAYQDHEVKRFQIPSGIDYELNEYIIKNYQKEFQEIYQAKPKQFWENAQVDTNDDSKFADYYGYLSFQNIQKAYQDFIEAYYMEEVDITKPMIDFTITYKNKNYHYFTNRIKEVKELQDKLVEEVKQLYNLDSGVDVDE